MKCECKKCKNILEFTSNNFAVAGKKLRRVCKKCENIRRKNNYHKNTDKNKKRYIENKDKILARNKKNYAEHQKKRLAQKAEYRKNNKDKIKEVNKKTYKRIKSDPILLECTNKKKKENYLKHKEKIILKNKIKYNSDPLIRLEQSLRNRLRKTIKGDKGNKTQKSFELTNCNIIFLKKYIEQQFDFNMSWDNYGSKNNEWSIEHIIPCKAFNLSNLEHQKKCFHWTNLKPVWHKDNIAKSDKIIFNNKEIRARYLNEEQKIEYIEFLPQFLFSDIRYPHNSNICSEALLNPKFTSLYA